jgi:hypothetical protein
MERYSVELELQRPLVSWRYKTVAALIFAAIFFAIRFGWDFVAPIEKERDVLSVALKDGLWALLMGTMMAFLPRPWVPSKPRISIDFFVDEESISSEFRSYGILKWRLIRRTVRRGKIRSVFEIKGRLGGIGISERGGFAARMWGYVYVPTSLPEYEEVKRLAESWRVVD